MEKREHRAFERVAVWAAYLTPLVALYSILQWAPRDRQHGTLLAWLTPLYMFVFVPCVDTAVSGGAAGNRRERRAHTPYFTLPLVLWLPVELGVLVAALLRGVPSAGARSAAQWAGYVLSTGIVMSMGINAAHEMNHKRDRALKAAARALLVLAGYGHFAIEHNYGHHKSVGLRHDAATARRDESFYRFYVRAVRGAYAGAMRVAPARVLADTALAALACLASGALYRCCAHVDGAPRSLVHGAVFHAASAWTAFTLLELANYVEHYGLERASARDPVLPRHSWNNPQLLTSYISFKLQYHSDHHMHAALWYTSLRNEPQEWPQHPAGLSAMMLLALVPPLWRRVVHPRLERVQPRQLRQARASDDARILQPSRPRGGRDRDR